MLALSFVDRDFACLDEADGSSQFAAYLFGVLHTLEELGNPALGLLLAALVVKGRQSTESVFTHKKPRLACYD